MGLRFFFWWRNFGSSTLMIFVYWRMLVLADNRDTNFSPGIGLSLVFESFFFGGHSNNFNRTKVGVGMG